MDRKVKNTILLIVILLGIALVGGIYAFVFQRNDINDLKDEKKAIQQNLTQYDTDALKLELNSLKQREGVMDSILALRKYNIPAKISETRFYDFVDKVSFDFSENSYANITYGIIIEQGQFKAHTYDVNGLATFNDLYRLVYAIEQSKELKKIKNLSLKDLVKIDQDGLPLYLVNFKFNVEAMFSDNNQYVSANIRENKLIPNPIYDIFYPQIRNEIPPNVDQLLDVQTGQLLALIPDGAFISDASGNTFLLWEGDRVYLGYLTKINYDTNEVSFILNKGGLIEKVTLTLEEKKN